MCVYKYTFIVIFEKKTLHNNISSKRTYKQKKISKDYFF